MNIREYLQKTLSISGSLTDANDIEMHYGIKLVGEAKKITETLDQEIFFEGGFFLKLLSKQEVIDASEDMQVDFTAKEVIPLFDIGDNDYIAYHYGKKQWCKFNIVDEIEFSIQHSVIEFFV